MHYSLSPVESIHGANEYTLTLQARTTGGEGGSRLNKIEGNRVPDDHVI